MRRYRTVIILLLLFVVPLSVAAVGARFLLPDGDAKPPQAKQAKPAPVARKSKLPRILAAARPLPVGTLIAEEDLIEIDAVDGQIRRGQIVTAGTKTTDSLRGHAVRQAVAEGAPLTRSSIVGPDQRGFLAAVLGPGTRAVTIGLEAGARHAGLIDPGDRVDVILTAKLRLADGAQSVFTRTILEDVRVVAVDRQVGTGTGAPEGGKAVKRGKIVTATLEVSPAQADRLALAEHEGTLSLAVRSLTADTRRTDSKALELEELLALPTAKPAEPQPVAAPAPLPPRKPETRTILVTARDLPVGTLLGEEDLDKREVKADQVGSGHFHAVGIAAIDALRGFAVREALPAGIPLHRSAVVGPKQRGFLAAALRPGTRAVTIRLGAGTRHAGLIDPGDRVDVILTAKLPLADGSEGVFTRTILEDMRVVAVDRRVGSGQESPQAGEQVKRTEIVTATLEASPAEADRLVLGEHQGTLSLTVRPLEAASARRSRTDLVDLKQLMPVPSPESSDPPDTEIDTVQPAQDPAESARAALLPRKTVRVIRGSEVTEQVFPHPADTRSGAPGFVPNGSFASEPTPSQAQPSRSSGVSR